MACPILWLEVEEETHPGNLTLWVHQILEAFPAASADQALCMSPSFVTSATEVVRRKSFLAEHASLDPQNPRDSFVMNVKTILIKLMAQVVCCHIVNLLDILFLGMKNRKF